MMIALKGHVLEYVDDGHIYLVDGVIVPSVTQVLQKRFGHKYDGIDREVLNNAAARGTAIHAAVEAYCTAGEVDGSPEVSGFRWLQKQYGFDVLANELPVILFDGEKPVAAGRLDMVLKMGDEIGGADIKTTSALDREYTALQLNLYRVAYRQCYGDEWKFLAAIHLRKDVRRFVPLPINEEMALALVREYLEDERSRDDEQSGFDW